MNDVRAGWISSTKQSPPALSSMETYNGLFAAPYAYNVSALAVDHLIGATSPQKLADYYEAIGQGLSAWQCGAVLDAVFAAYGRPLATMARG